MVPYGYCGIEACKASITSTREPGMTLLPWCLPERVYSVQSRFPKSGFQPLLHNQPCICGRSSKLETGYPNVPWNRPF